MVMIKKDNTPTEYNWLSSNLGRSNTLGVPEVVWIRKYVPRPSLVKLVRVLLPKYCINSIIL